MTNDLKFFYVKAEKAYQSRQHCYLQDSKLCRLPNLPGDQPRTPDSFSFSRDPLWQSTAVLAGPKRQQNAIPPTTGLYSCALQFDLSTCTIIYVVALLIYQMYILISYPQASFWDHFSFRSSETGSWFIQVGEIDLKDLNSWLFVQALCDKIDRSHPSDPLFDVLLEVSAQVI